MKRIIFIIIFTLYVLTLMLSCTGVKHLTKTINKAFEKKDSVINNDSVKVSKDSSKFNSEIVIEYDSAKFQEQLLEGSDADWDPFYPPQEFNQIIDKIEKQPIKRITIKTNVQLHKSDSAVYHETAKVKTDTKTVAVNKVVEKKKRSYWWILLLLIPILFLLYEKYKSKLPKWFTFLGGLKIF